MYNVYPQQFIHKSMIGWGSKIIVLHVRHVYKNILVSPKRKQQREFAPFDVLTSTRTSSSSIVYFKTLRVIQHPELLGTHAVQRQRIGEGRNI